MKKSIFIALVFAAAVAVSGKHPEFSHDVTGNIKPWTNENFPDLSVNNGEFSFAVIPDRTGRARKGVFERAMKKINMLRPDLPSASAIWSKAVRSVKKVPAPSMPSGKVSGQ